MKKMSDFLWGVASVVRRTRQLSTDWAKIEAAVYYLKSVKKLRQVVIGLTIAAIAFMVLANGFLLVHLALAGLAPWSARTKLVVLLSVGAAEFLIPLCGLAFVFSQKLWMHLSKSDEVTEEALHGASDSESATP